MRWRTGRPGRSLADYRWFSAVVEETTGGWRWTVEDKAGEPVGTGEATSRLVAQARAEALLVGAADDYWDNYEPDEQTLRRWAYGTA